MKNKDKYDVRKLVINTNPVTNLFEVQRMKITYEGRQVANLVVENSEEWTLACWLEEDDENIN